ncbi:MAG: hypothetical protein AAF355_13215 [Myxococcota bacterium]
MAKLRILDEADREVEEAAAHLEGARAGTGRIFLRAYRHKIGL